jgi:putative Mn2+ efflux pump MntP
MDAFAVGAAVAATLESVTFRHTFRLTWHFGLFQALMTIIGWLGGAGLSALLFGLNDWIAFGLLAAIGVNMLRESGHQQERARDFDPTRGWSLVGLSIATSIDALAVGVSLSLIGAGPIWTPALVIGAAALIMTLIGMKLGRRAGVLLGGWAEKIGGIVLIGIAVRILVQHLTG